MEQRRRKQLLIVEDQTEVMKYFLRILTTKFPDLLVEHAKDGAEAIEMFSQHHHDLLIIDLQMPVMTGEQAQYEICMICENRGWDPPPIIFVTGYEPAEEVRQIIDDNPSYSLLLKPIHPDVLVPCVRKVLYPELEGA
jgi:CheY-like chemotaxis protein